MFDVYLIADVATLGAARVVDACARALGTVSWAGRVGVQLRAKNVPAEVALRLARSLRAVTTDLDVPLLINGPLDVACTVQADGVHLPERGPSIAFARHALGPRGWIGVSRHDAAGLARAAEDGASFATLSPVFTSPGKGTPLGITGFCAMQAHVAPDFPVLALGGVEATSARALIEAGARGVAVVRGVFLADDPPQQLTELAAVVARARREKLDTLAPESRRFGTRRS